MRFNPGKMRIKRTLEKENLEKLKILAQVGEGGGALAPILN